MIAMTARVGRKKGLVEATKICNLWSLDKTLIKKSDRTSKCFSKTAH